MSDAQFMRLALRLARRGYGMTSPNPMVGAVLVRNGKIIGRGWHRRVGGPHAEIEAFGDARKRGHNLKGATLCVTLEPCSTHGRTPPCTEAIITAGIRRVVAGALDPNPKHAGRAFKILRRAGIEVVLLGDKTPRVEAHGRARHSVRAIRDFDGNLRRARSDAPSERSALADECTRLNEAFNHWIVRRTPWVTVKAAMTLDGKIATAAGESKWITGAQARAHGMKLRQGADAILVGVNTVLSDDPSLTIRPSGKSKGVFRGNIQHPTSNIQRPILRRVVLDSRARTPLTAKVVTDEWAALTTVVVSVRAPKSRVRALAERVHVLVAPPSRSKVNKRNSKIDLQWLLRRLGAEDVTSLLVEGGGEVNASFLLGGFAHRIVFFYAPRILGGRASRPAVGGEGAAGWKDILKLEGIRWGRLGPDLVLTARVM
ncbi:MAG: bifunctional diaminohydroxyphosphoribosylaminopyrimidine deaminase/5-amino-6-(5-phosphoribosylamino)uracil reductase RibD [Verrucomicrobiota bacterium]